MRPDIDAIEKAAKAWMEIMDAHGLCAYDIPKLIAHIRELEAEIVRLKDVISNDTYCAYCGHAYPRGTPKSHNAALTAHIKVCPEHPMRRLEAEVADLQAKLSAKEQGGEGADHRETTSAV